MIQPSLRAEAKPFVPKTGYSGGQGSTTMSSAPPVDTMDSTENGEDDLEIRAALNIIQPGETVTQQLEPEKDSTVNYKFCSTCACPITGSTQLLESDNSTSTPESAENLYHNHCCTEEQIMCMSSYTKI